MAHYGLVTADDEEMEQTRIMLLESCRPESERTCVGMIILQRAEGNW